MSSIWFSIIICCSSREGWCANLAWSSQNTLQGFSIGTDGIGWYYNIRGGNGRSAGYDVAFRPGGYTVMLVSGIILSIFQPEAAPVVESAAEEIIAHSY